MAGYQIADEPAPGPLAQFAVNPIFPLLALMLGGVWIAWPWFAFNAYAVGSPTRGREWAWLGIGLVALFALAYTVVAVVAAEIVTGVGVRYAVLSVTVAKLAVVYAVFVLQSRTIEIYEYYGGVLRNGIIVIVALVFVGRSVFPEWLPDFFLIVLS